MFKRKKKDEILSDHDAVQILDTIDKLLQVTSAVLILLTLTTPNMVKNSIKCYMFLQK